MPSSLSFSTVDVFTKKAFRGNQLAIIYMPTNTTLSQQNKQAIAREFNFSESVFLHDAEEQQEGSDHRRHKVDIFTTAEELPFAGHPTIGTLVHLCRSASPPLSRVTLVTKAGPIVGRYDAASEMAEAEIPHDVCLHEKRVPREAVLSSQMSLNNQEAMGPGLPQLPLVSIVKGMSFILIELDRGLERLDGQSQKIVKGSVELDTGWAPSLIGAYYFTVDRISGSGRDDRSLRYQIRARMLEESIGEDPATGSAASCLAVYLALQGGKDDGVYEFDIEQGIDMGRASLINVKVELAAGGKKVAKVILAGSAVLVTEGKLHMPKN